MTKKRERTAHLNHGVVVEVIVGQLLVGGTSHAGDPVTMQEAGLHYPLDKVHLVLVHQRVGEDGGGSILHRLSTNDGCITKRKESDYLKKRYPNFGDDQMDGLGQHHCHSVCNGVSHLVGAVVAKVCHDPSELAATKELLHNLIFQHFWPCQNTCIYQPM